MIPLAMQAYVETSVVLAVTQQAVAFGALGHDPSLLCMHVPVWGRPAGLPSCALHSLSLSLSLSLALTGASPSHIDAAHVLCCS